MDKIKRFIECLVPVTACNLKCEYCYVIQENRRKLEMPKFKYSPQIIGKGLSKERLGGIAYISICGAGETLLPKEMPQIVKEILKQGHYVNITTNGTITERFNEIIEITTPEMRKRLHFAFSLHYIELKNTNNLEKFISNVKKVKESGASILVQFNLYDGYLPYIDEIKKICIDNFGALPQVAATRKETVKITTIQDIEYHTNKTFEEYVEIGKQFKSPLFDYTTDKFMVKRNEFCYAGDWSFILNLATGMIKKCYAEKENQDIFKNINKPIKFCAIGNNCESRYCVNSSHFISLGIIPEIHTKTYAELRNRKEANWYSDEMNNFLNSKLFESNKEYNKKRKLGINTKYKIKGIFQKGKMFIKKVVRYERRVKN